MTNDSPKKNSAKGKDSFDADIGGSLVSFFNKNITPYPTEVGGPSFDLIPIPLFDYILVARAYEQR